MKITTLVGFGSALCGVFLVVACGTEGARGEPGAEATESQLAAAAGTSAPVGSACAIEDEQREERCGANGARRGICERDANGESAHWSAWSQCSDVTYVVAMAAVGDRCGSPNFHRETTIGCPDGAFRRSICLGDGAVADGLHWSDWSACQEETSPCQPGTLRTSTCGQCGTVSSVCGPHFTWFPGACWGEHHDGCAVDATP